MQHYLQKVLKVNPPNEALVGCEEGQRPREDAGARVLRHRGVIARDRLPVAPCLK